MQVCNTSQCDVVTYDVGGSVGTHSAVKVNFGGNIKYMSKYGRDGPLVVHNLNGSWYHYVYTVSLDGYWAYMGISGSPNITGTGNVAFSVNNVSGVTYAWSIISGGSNIYISSASNQNTVTLTPLHSGPCSS